MKSTEILIDKARMKLNFWQKQMDVSPENSKRYQIAMSYRQNYANAIFYMINNKDKMKKFSLIKKS